MIVLVEAEDETAFVKALRGNVCENLLYGFVWSVSVCDEFWSEGGSDFVGQSSRLHPITIAPESPSLESSYPCAKTMLPTIVRITVKRSK